MSELKLVRDLSLKSERLGYERVLFPAGVLPIMAYTGRLSPKGVPFPGFRYIKE